MRKLKVECEKGEKGYRKEMVRGRIRENIKGRSK